MKSKIVSEVPQKLHSYRGKYSEFHDEARALPAGKWLEISCDNFAEAGKVASGFRLSRSTKFEVRVVNHNVYVRVKHETQKRGALELASEIRRLGLQGD